MMSRLIKIILSTVFVGVIVILTFNILLPSFKDPNSRVYSSSYGYPARQRAKGQPIVVETALAQSTPLEDSLAAPGEAVPLEEIEINPQIKGIVAEVYVAEGEKITQGQPLVKIEPSEYEAKVNLARNNLEIAQSQLELLKTSAKGRLQRLEKNAAVAETQLQQAEMKIQQIKGIMPELTPDNLPESEEQVTIIRRVLQETKQLIKKIRPTQEKLSLTQTTIAQQIDKGRLELTNRQLKLEMAVQDLQRTVISAPADGLVSQVNAARGELVYPGNRSPLLTINGQVTFKAYVDQTQLNALQVSDRATVYLNAYPGQTFSGKVIKINPTVETTANRRYKRGINQQYTYAVWIDLEDIDLPPGVQGYAQFKLVQNSITIPEGSVTHLSGGEGMVMVVDSGHAVVKAVKLGKKFHDLRQVLAGLEAGEPVVIHPRAINPGDLLLSAEGV
ncbi:MAG: HlyD family efflux transporter periplasmic adaptor subunit [Symploca sp. SIO1B1]|nr:HlyD family efflux transporter periplasmic adaptor subunit [Symploca sp. SIO1C2]NER95097.1 HlyD family efflux transporter periplasmic adaptor subunit [Symploca sp. SIO1B1]